jgi:uncharacterized membrane protein YphA (DoxX/SURF4 family)
MTVYTIFGIVAAIAFALALLRFIVKRPPNILITFLQDFIGAFFIFSGFVKAVDPLGTSYKMHEYFEAFAGEGLRPVWEYLAHFSTFFAIVMIAAELFIGLMLIIGWKPRFTVGVIWLLTLFFTFLTGYTYLSGFCISKLFMLSSAGVFVLLAAAAFPPKESTRNNIVFFSLGLVAVLFIMGKFSGMFFTCDFKESGMKVTDCGCFGDFIKLKPWQTFYKDTILDVIILILLLNTKNIRPTFSAMWLNVTAGVMAAAALGFCLYNTYFNEPVIDFRPYAIGQDINDNMKDNDPQVMKMTYVYKDKKTGQEKEIPSELLSDPAISAEIANMTYVKRNDVITHEGKPIRISNLFIEDEDGNQMSDSILHNPNYSLMVVSFDLNQAHESAFRQLNDIANACDKAGIKFFAVVANDGKVDEFRHRNQTAYPYYYADATPLKTMIRSNPGLMLLKNGVVINKWHYRHLPTFDELNQTYFKK